jgi:phosphoglycolate phosphatase-like HAD superfamily hydrolase
LSPKPKIVLFDIDNTLLYTGGAASLAMKRAFFDLFGVEDGFAGIDFSGLTDTAILRGAVTEHGVEGDFDRLFARFKDAYLQHLPHLLPHAQAEGKGGVFPGVRDVLDTLSAGSGIALGLATGNIRAGASLKLDYYGLGHYFLDGGFGDDAEERSGVVAIATKRLGSHLHGFADKDVYVIGDTPRDVSAAKENEAIAIGVATGRYSEEELRAHGADLTMPDLAHSEPLERLLAG